MPTWKTFKKYLDRNGWEHYGTTDHYKYRKFVDGEMLITKCSMGSGEIGHDLWQRILKRELQITQSEFTAGLK